MNREILFRAKSGQTWYYGGIHKTRFYFSKTSDDYNYRYYLTTETDDEYRVSPNTICQFTGLTDKNGIKIFEGDIISKEFYTNHKQTKSKSFKGVVEYKVRCDKGFGIDGEDFKSWAAEWSVNFNFGSDEQKYRAYSWGLFFDCEVIGNIYDNPELIEK